MAWRNRRSRVHAMPSIHVCRVRLALGKDDLLWHLTLDQRAEPSIHHRRVKVSTRDLLVRLMAEMP